MSRSSRAHFLCPQCASVSLSIQARLELPPDARSDEITLQIVGCSDCGLRAAAVYEESRRGASESWHHHGYRLDEPAITELEALLLTCPRPGDPQCSCPAHEQLATTDLRGYWRPPFPTDPRFSLRRA